MDAIMQLRFVKLETIEISLQTFDEFGRSVESQLSKHGVSCHEEEPN